MSPLLSIVIPIYNAEKYIESCLNSILNAPALSDQCEIIAVDDCSTDGSAALIESYARQNPSVRLVRQEHNAGTSAARNRGICEARGEYLWFVDDDDMIGSQGLGDLIALLSTRELDLVAFNFLQFGEDGAFRARRYELRETPVLSGMDLFAEQRIFSTPWNKVVRRSILMDNGLFYRPGILPEDLEWLTRCYIYARKAKALSAVLYYNRCTPNSQSKGSRAPLAYISGYTKIIEEQCPLICEFPHPKFWSKTVFYMFSGYNFNLQLARELELISDDEVREGMRWEQCRALSALHNLPVCLSKEYLGLRLLSINPSLYTGARNLFRRLFNDVRSCGRPAPQQEG